MRCWPVLIALSTAGCLILPTGQIRLDSTSRRPIPAARIDALEPGTATRIDVLLSLGAPEIALEGEHIFLYQWATKSGFLLADRTWGELNMHLYDHAFVFDHSGGLVESGDLKTLMEGGYWRNKPLDIASPLELGIVIQRPFRIEQGVMVLEEDQIRFEVTGEDATTFTIPRGGVLELDYRTTGEAYSLPGARRFEFRFRDSSGEVEERTIQIEVRSLITLTRYLYLHSPEIKIRD